MSTKYHYETKEVCIDETNKNWGIFHGVIAVFSAFAILLILASEVVAPSILVFQIIIFVTNALTCVIRLKQSHEIKKVRVYEKDLTDDEKLKAKQLGEG